MNSVIIANLLRFVGLTIIQVLVLKNMHIDTLYIQILLYPTFILLLPVNTPHSLGILLGFVIGIAVDVFYGSLGVHGAASVFTAFVRPLVLGVLEPKSGYTTLIAPSKSKLGINWFLRYSAILMAAHLFFYFSVEVFTLYYIGEILLKTFLSFIFSMIFVLLYQYLFDPVE